MLKIEDMHNVDVTELTGISEELWKLGSLENIKENVSPEVFYLHVGINMIGIWKSEDWSGILGEQADLVPYIPWVLEALCLPDIREAFEKVIELFPEGTVFKSDSEEYYDIYNFLGTFSYKVQNEKFKTIAPEKRREMVKLMRQRVKVLDELTEQYWQEDAEAGGWKRILDYVQKIN